jgi:hypothetical protein
VLTVPIRAAGLAVIAALALVPARVHASGSPHLSAALYPARTRITTIDPLSNQRMDCNWGFSCRAGQPDTSAPVFHLRTQDDLHRLSGWAQFGDTPGGSSRMLFALFASRYSPGSEEGMPWNVLAFSDFRAVLISDRYAEIERFPRLIPAGQIGNSSAQRLRSRDGDALAMSCWVGTVEVEGLAMYAHRSASQERLAMHDLSRQVRAAVKDVLSAGGNT